MNKAIFLVIVQLLFVVDVFAADYDSSSAESLSDFYHIGMKEYSDNNYLSALKHLFAYRSVNKKLLESQLEFSKDLDDAITYCENKIQEKMAASQSWERIIGRVHDGNATISVGAWSTIPIEEQTPEQAEAAMNWTRKMIEVKSLEAEMIRLEAIVPLHKNRYDSGVVDG
jgi:hypothetical protein